MSRRKLSSPTSYDVAKHAGVSQAVVSRAYQTNAPISEAARQRVLQSAQALGYSPNAVARSMITKRSGMVGVLLTEATQRDTPDVLILLSKALLARGLQPLLFPCSTESDGDTALDKALAFGVDGVVGCVGLSNAALARAELRQRPMVLFNRISGLPGVYQVGCDHAGAAALVASRLFAAGHRQFAVVTGPREGPVSKLRVEHFVGRLRELGVGPVATFEGDYHYESGHAAAMQLLATSASRPDAIFCANDAMALGVLDAARFALMLRVPRDVSVVGFDDIPAGRRPAYLLTTVRQPLEEMAEAAAVRVHAAVEGLPVSSQPVMLAGTLLVRGSAELLPGLLESIG
jgi:DNA-binding LacI/PurR family transcriptional regulator